MKRTKLVARSATTERRSKSRRISCTAGAWAALAIALLWTPLATAGSGRADYDLDDDRLIEINDLQDLDQVRFNLDGSGIYGEPAAVLGCPGGCIGFELNANLDFDTNGSGDFDSGDQFYNGGNGWIPIGLDTGVGSNQPYTGLFEGNTFVISNMTCMFHEACGLFAEVLDTTLRNVHMTNAWVYTFDDIGVIAAWLTNSTLQRSHTTGYIGPIGGSYTGGLVAVMTDSVIDESYSQVDLAGGQDNGGLVGTATNSTIRRSFSTGRIVSSRQHPRTGGIAGSLIGSTIENCFATGNVGRSPESGGLVGAADNTSSISRSFATGHLLGEWQPLGGLVGSGDATLIEAYWATDLSGQETSAGIGGQGYLSTQLRCPSAPSDGACGPLNLYPSWGTQLNSSGAPLWNFGNNQEFPGLNIQGTLFRDADGDGVLDGADYYRLNYAASANSDGDMSIDRWKEGCDQTCRSASGLVLDQFPTNIAATYDLDLDGQPESWNPFCFGQCQANSGLTIDQRPGDQDNDLIADASDADDNGDSVPDVDANSNGLVDIEDWFELDMVRFQMRGHGQRLVENGPQLPDGSQDDTSDTSGCPPRVFNGIWARACAGYELLADLDFDTSGNGVIDAADEYYEDGKGWPTIGHDSDIEQTSFQTLFEGNGHVISNLYLNVDNGDQMGLFGSTRDAVIQNLGLDGPLMQIYAGSSVGALIGNATNTVVRNVYSTGLVQAHSSGAAGGLVAQARDSHLIGCLNTGDVDLLSQCDLACAAGGLVGRAEGGSITASFATGNVAGNWTNTGGFVGLVMGGFTGAPPTTIEASYSTGFVGGNSPIGGFVATMPNNTISSHWAADSSGQPGSAGNPVAASFTQLQCPVSANNTTCAASTLYSGWDTYQDEAGDPYWDFGTNAELPGLCLGGTLFRDGNGDGLLDPPSACNVAPSSPCAGICSNPVSIGWANSYNNNTLGTGEVCFETTQTVHGGNCGNFASGRQLSVNNVQKVCNGQNWASVPPPVNGGYCIRATSGNYSWAFLTLW